MNVIAARDDADVANQHFDAVMRAVLQLPPDTTPAVLLAELQRHSHVLAANDARRKSQPKRRGKIESLSAPRAPNSRIVDFKPRAATSA